MNNRYKIIVSNKKIYKEIELSSDSRVVKIGTTKNCHVRFDKAVFFEDFEIEAENDRDNWKLSCSDTIYFISDGVTKMYSKELQHGDDIIVKYESSKQEVFKLSFMLDFDFEKKEYDRVIDISGIDTMQIGGHNRCELFLKDELIGNDTVTVSKKNGSYQIVDNHSKYGVYINTDKVKNSAKIVDFDFFSIIGYSFYLKYGKLYTDSHNGIVISSLPYVDTKEQTSTLSYPKFNRNTRIKPVISSEKIEVLDPPSLMEKPKSNIVLSLAPALGMLGLTVILRGVMGGGGSFVIFSVCTMGMGIVTSIFSFFGSKKDYKKGIKERVIKYNEYIENKRIEVNKYRKEEFESLEEMYFPLPRELEMVNEFSGDLFNRKASDADFLHVRLGTGSVTSKQPVENKKQEKLETVDELANIPEHLAQEYKCINHAPVVADFAKAAAIGVIGPSTQLYSMMKNMALDLCIRQYYKDLKILFVVDPEHAQLIQWVRLLPHAYNDDLDTRNIVCDDESKNVLFEYLFKELSRREAQKISEPHFVVLVFDEMGIKSHPISRYIQKANKFGFTFVFFEYEKELLPMGCNKIITLRKNESAGTVTDSEDSSDTTDFSYDSVDDMKASEAVSKLAPVYCEEVSLESSLTRNISLYELLHILSADDLDLAGRWQSSAVFNSMAAPLGVRKGNEIVFLDLHEKAHGPHGLVAGTTGSGKSEILQSYILSMATLYHPYEVGFVIIDFKGGGMVNQFKDLPHLIGAITNIDGKEINRNLQAIKAELQRRQRLFAENNVNQINNYIKRYKAGEISVPIPHLILIVDEFAELKAEQPEFMKELISAARIGRSLGVHLILATQKPSGQVNEQIWSNSKFKLCLKVQNKEDSNEVIKSPLAAEIKEPGRAYLQVGNNEIFELFQSAYSGSPAKVDESGRVNEFRLSEIALSGKRKMIFQQKKSKSDNIVVTQLEAVVEYVDAYCKKNNIERLPSICLPPLPDMVEFDSNTISTSHSGSFMIPAGFYDDPTNQYQGTAFIDISSDNTLVIGSSQTGKTNFIQCIVRSLASQYSPGEVNIYIMDFGSMVLKNLETLNHVGGVVFSSEAEKIKNLFKLLLSEVAVRKARLLSVGVSSFLSYKEAGYTDIPQIFLIVDNFTAFKELYAEKHEESFVYICREGIAAGVSVIISNSQTNGLGYKYMSNFANRIAFSCNEKGEYSTLFDRCHNEPKNIPGRALFKTNKTIYEMQTYLSFSGEKEIDRTIETKEFISSINSQYKEIRAKAIPSIPDCLTKTYLKNNYSSCFAQNQIPYALNYSSVDLVSIDCSTLFELAVLGKNVKAKLNFLQVVMNYISVNIFENPTEVYIVDGIERNLKKMEEGFVKKYTIDFSEAADVISTVNEILEKRYTMLMERGLDAISECPQLIVIINSREAVESISADKGALAMFNKIAKQYRALKILFIFSDIDDAPAAYSAPELVKHIKETRKCINFNNINEQKLFDLTSSITRNYNTILGVGDAYYLEDSNFSKIKVVMGD